QMLCSAMHDLLLLSRHDALTISGLLFSSTMALALRFAQPVNSKASGIMEESTTPAEVLSMLRLSILSGFIVQGCLGKHGRKIKRSEEHTSELQSRENLVCRLLLE